MATPAIVKDKQLGVSTMLGKSNTVRCRAFAGPGSDSHMNDDDIPLAMIVIILSLRTPTRLAVGFPDIPGSRVLDIWRAILYSEHHKERRSARARMNNAVPHTKDTGIPIGCTWGCNLFNQVPLVGV